MRETYEVTDGKISIPSDVLLGGEDYHLRQNGQGEYYLVHMPRRDDDGSRRVLILEEGCMALQRFCHEIAQMMGHRPEYSLALSGLMVWSLEAERWPHAQTLVQHYGEALYRGEKRGSREGARFMRLFRDAMSALQQFASGMSEVLGGMNAERTVVLTALTIWAVKQEEALDVVDEYAVRIYTMRREARKQAQSKQRESESGEGQSDGVVDND